MGFRVLLHFLVWWKLNYCPIFLRSALVLSPYHRKILIMLMTHKKKCNYFLFQKVTAVWILLVFHMCNWYKASAEMHQEHLNASEGVSCSNRNESLRCLNTRHLQDFAHVTHSQRSSSKHRNDQTQNKSKLLNYYVNFQVVAAVQLFEPFTDVFP